MKDFHGLKVWQKARQLTLAVYQITADFPREELYGLTAQIRRSSSSIPANLAEGCGRSGTAEFARFCSIAMGSASELEYHLLLAGDLKLIRPEDYDSMAQRAIEVKRMLAALIKKLTADRLPLIRDIAATAKRHGAPPQVRHNEGGGTHR